MNVSLLIIDCIGNLQVGSGKDNDGLIDNLIQRDPVTGFPCIFSSSLKGALREHCSKLLPEGINEKIFGKKVDDQKALACKPGAYRFTDAMLLAMPDITNAHNYPYQLVSCHEILDELRKEAQLFGGENAINEAIECGGGMTSIIDGDERIMLDVNNFLRYFADDEHLPVIARNYLENGVSANLWYEQVLPRRSRLAAFVLYEGEIEASFVNAISNTIVQIGANATVGYGLCKITVYSNTGNNETI